MFFSRFSGWWFQAFFEFSPLLGEMIQIDEHIFQVGSKPPGSQAIRKPNGFLRFLGGHSFASRPCVGFDKKLEKI